MLEPAEFDEFMRRVRAGDEEAAAELVRRYEPLIRREVRVRLSDPRLNRVLDSMDICQSVLGSFFVRAALGEYDVAEPGQLIRLLVGMTRNKVAHQVRTQQAQRRDYRRVGGPDAAAEALIDPEPSPSRQLAARELYETVVRQLSPEERQLVERRAAGQDWAAIAHDLGGNAAQLRKRLSRVLSRVGRDLGLDEADDHE